MCHKINKMNQNRIKNTKTQETQSHSFSIMIFILFTFFEYIHALKRRVKNKYWEATEFFVLDFGIV